MRKNEKLYIVRYITDKGKEGKYTCIVANNTRQAAKIAYKINENRIKSPLLPDPGDIIKISNIRPEMLTAKQEYLKNKKYIKHLKACEKKLSEIGGIKNV